MNNLIRVSALAVLAAGVAAGTPGEAAAEVNFKNKNITMVIGNSPGGGTDAVGRLVGEYMARYLPGSPTLIVRNMPGAGGITSLNFFANQVKPDGLTISTNASTQSDPVRWRSKGSRYDPRTFEVIGGIIRGSTFLLLNKDALPRLTDKSKPPVVIGAVDGTRSGIVMSMWGGKYLGWNIKWVVGYGGTADMMLALQRGEIDLTSTGNSFHIRELAQKGFHLLYQSGTLEDGKLIARADFPNVPLFPNAVRPQLKSELEKQAFDYWEGINATDKWLALPPKTPKEFVKVYEAAFIKAVRDPEFRKRGAATISEDIGYLNAADQTKLINQLASTPDEALAFIDSIKQEQGLRALEIKLKTVSTTIDEVKDNSRVLEFKVNGNTETVQLSGGETKVKIGGKDASRRDIKAGMSCDVSYPKSGAMATAVTCK